MTELEYKRYVLSIEKDPLFLLMRASRQGRSKILRRRPWSETRFRFQELAYDPPERSLEKGHSATEVPEQIRRLIQRIGQKDFERYFLYNEDELDKKVIADDLKLSEREVHQVADFLDRFELEEGAGAGALLPSPSSAVETIASLAWESDRRLTIFMSVHYARGRYVIDYDRLEELKRSDPDVAAHWGKFKSLIHRIELVNRKQTALTGAIRFLAEAQAPYFLKEDPSCLKPLLQRDAAAHLKIAPSSVCRVIDGRALRTPWGEEQPLKFFFPSQRQVALFLVRAILREKPALKDKGLWDVLKNKHRMNVSLRSVNMYRHEALKSNKSGDHDS
jgi:hypothetical protein